MNHIDDLILHCHIAQHYNVLHIYDGVLAQRDAQYLLGAGRRTVGHYKHSNVSYHALQRI